MTAGLGLTYRTTLLNDTQVMVALVNDSSYAFVWHGGAYIDVCVMDSMGNTELFGTWYRYGDENINVWDYSTDKPEIEWLDSTEFLYTINEWLGAR